MRRVALIVFILGVLVLALLLNLPSREIKGFDDLSEFEINQRVLLNGVVESERFISGSKEIFVVNGIDVVCDCSESFVGREVEVEGVVSEFNEKKQVEVLSIKFK